MSSIKFGTAVLDPVPAAEPGRIPLRRRASAPELADLLSIQGNAPQPYEVGNIVRIQLAGQCIQAKIIKAFTPFTMAQAMIVQIFEPTLDLEGQYVLKVHDRRCSPAMRESDKSGNWTTSRDLEFEKRRWSKDFIKYFLHLMANKHRFYDGDDFWSDDASDIDQASEDYDQAESAAYEELRIHTYCLKMYNAELEVYRRAREHGMDGTDVPRFISSVRVPPNYTSKFCQLKCSSIKGTPGILMQYVPGFSMKDLYDTPEPPAPREHWKHIIDDCLRIIAYYTQNMELCNTDDQNNDRNSVVHWDPIAQKWKCKLIDFGHCKFREKETRKWEWRHEQAMWNGESAVALLMERRLEKNKGFQYTWDWSQYCEDLSNDFCGEYSTGIEPDGYES